MNIQWKTSNTGITFAGVGKPQSMFWEIKPNDPAEPEGAVWVEGHWGPRGSAPMFKFCAINLVTAKEMVEQQLKLSGVDKCIGGL